MNPVNIKETFEASLPHLKIDTHLCNSLRKYVQNFMNKNKDHAGFFGGNLLGVHPARFLDSDRHRWFDEIIDADEETLKVQLHALPSIDPNFFISSNAMNLSCAYLTHAIFRSALSAKDKKEAIVNVLLILQFKFITSILQHYFRYPADKAVAEATYASLTQKFAIKEHGSWIGVLTNRCEDILAPTSIHYDVISRFDQDEDIVNMLNDVQGRIRSMVKNIYRVMLRVREEGTKIGTTSNVVSHDGEEILRDKINGLGNYIHYLKSVVGDKNSFVREELLGVVGKILPSAQARYLRPALEFISAQYFKENHKDYERVFTLTLVHSYSYLSNNRSAVRSGTDLGDMLIKLRGAYTSSRSNDTDLLELRESVETLIRPSVDSRTASVLSSVRTGVLLYLVARAYTMQYYSSSQ